MPLDPHVAALIEARAAQGLPRISAGTPEDARRLIALDREALGRGPALPRVEAVSIDARSGAVPGRLYVPDGGPLGLAVYLHGGGWVVGALDDFDAFARTLAARSGCALLLADYRLAPEHLFPAAAEDAVDAVLWTHRHGARLLGREVPLAVAGDSAGGNLAAVAAAELRGAVPLALQLLIYPVTNRDFDTPSYRAHADDPLLARDDMRWFFDHYAPGVGRDDARLAPLARADLAGLPPACVVLAGYDVLRDEGAAYADRLAEAGVPVERHDHPGLPHGFVRLHGLVPAADRAVAEIAGALRRACAGSGPAAGG